MMRVVRLNIRSTVFDSGIEKNQNRVTDNLSRRESQNNDYLLREITDVHVAKGSEKMIVF